MKEDNIIKVLFLPAWYPHKHDPMFGLFVKQHAKTLKGLADVSVIYAVQDASQSETYKAETRVEEGLTEIIIYIKSSRLPLSLLRRAHNIFRYFSAQKAGWKILKTSDIKPDICHVHILTRAGLFALFLKIFRGIPYVVTEHWSRYFAHNDHFKHPVHKWITRKVVRGAGALTSVSGVLREAMQAKGLMHKSWTLLPNVIDTKRFIPLDKEEDKKLTRLFHLSCFEDQSKNISGMLRAYAKSLQQRPDMELVMIGDGPDNTQLMNYSRELGIKEQQIRFTGVLEGSELVEEMRACDFSVLFSNYETFGIVVLESIALGKPVVASRAGALPEILPENCGTLVDKGDEEALSHAILEMAEKHSTYDVDEMHAYVADHYDTRVVGYQLLNLYQSQLKHG